MNKLEPIVYVPYMVNLCMVVCYLQDYAVLTVEYYLEIYFSSQNVRTRNTWLYNEKESKNVSY